MPSLQHAKRCNALHYLQPTGSLLIKQQRHNCEAQKCCAMLKLKDVGRMTCEHVLRNLCQHAWCMGFGSFLAAR